MLGIAHPTGYPTYVIAAWLGQLFPVGSVAFRANALSALTVSLTIALTVAIRVRLGVRPLIAVGAALCVGAVTTIWAAATAAEVNGLQSCSSPSSSTEPSSGATASAARCCHRRAADRVGSWQPSPDAVRCPYVILFVLWTGRHDLILRPVVLIAGIAALLLGLTVYLYIPIAASRTPPLPYNHPVTLEAVWWLVSGTQFRDQFDFLSSAGPLDLVRSLPSLWSLLVARATVVIPALGLVGLGVLIRRRSAFGLTLGGILIGSIYLWAGYLKLEHYLLATWLLLAIGFTTALDVAVDQLERIARARRAGRRARFPSRAGLVAGLATAAFSVGLTAAHWDASDRSDDDGAAAFVGTAWRILPPNAAILTEWDVSTPLWHSQVVLGARPDVLVVDDTNIVYDGWGSREDRIAALIC